MPRNLPLIYSCSGASSVAQLANHVAVALHREGRAEMSCIAGVGGDVPALVRVATSGRPIVAVDGCKLRCVRSSLERHGVVPAVQVDLDNLGVKKVKAVGFDPGQAREVLGFVRGKVDGLAESVGA